MINDIKNKILDSVPEGVLINEAQLNSFVRNYRGFHLHKQVPSIGDLDRVFVMAPDPRDPHWLIALVAPIAIERALDNSVIAQAETWTEYLLVPGPDSRFLRECRKLCSGGREDKSFSKKELDKLYQHLGIDIFDPMEAMENELPYGWNWVSSSDVLQSTNIAGRKRYSVTITDNVIQCLVGLGYLVAEDKLILETALGENVDIGLIEERVKWYEGLGKDLYAISSELVWREELQTFING